MVVVRVVAVLAMLVVMVVVVVVVVVVTVAVARNSGSMSSLALRLKPAQVEHLRDRHLAEMHGAAARAGSCV